MRTLLLSALAILSLLVAATGAAASPSVGEGAPGDDPDAPGASALRVRADDAVRYIYTIEQRGDVEGNMQVFATSVSGTLTSQWSWRRSNITFRRSTAGQRPDLRIILASPEEVAAAAPVCSEEYSCRVGDQVLINDDAWRNDTAAWESSLEEYRDYLVNHEVGHWLGLDHRTCPGTGQESYVMQQQSITLGGCDEHGWPRYAEILEAADRNATSAAPAGHGRTGVVGDPLWFFRDGLRIGRSTTAEYGVNRDVPVVGDWDGDGQDTIGVFFDGIWSLNNGLDGQAEIRVEYGRRGDVPVVGDWNADGRDEIGVYRDGEWHLRNTSLPGGYTLYRTRYGLPTDVPVVGDWNGDGRDGIGAYRDGEWYLRTDPSAGGTTDARPYYGYEGDVPVIGDWENDGRDGIGVYRDGYWYARSALSRTGPTVATTFYGWSDDTPIVGDWDDDSYDQIGVVRGRL